MNTHELFLLKKISATPYHIQSAFNNRTIQRGLNYFRNNYVKNISVLKIIANNGPIISAAVTGSEYHVYHTEVLMDKDNITSVCSCPVQTNCKHGVAVIFAYLRKLKPNLKKKISPAKRFEQDVDQWLSGITSIEQNIDKPTDEREHLIFLLSIQDNDGVFVFGIEPVKARALKNGGYGQSFQIYNSNFDSQRIYVNQEQREAYFSLQALPDISDSYNNIYHLNNEFAEFILEKLFQSSVLFWHENKKTPITKGDEKVIQMKWQTEKNKLTLEYDIDLHDNHFLVAIKNTYYYDEEANTLGLVIHPEMPSTQIIKALKAPVIPQEKAKNISQKILIANTFSAVPLPVELNIKTKEIQQETPINKLKLYTRTIHQNIVYIAQLSFQYGRINYQTKTEAEFEQPIFSLIKNKIHYKIHRDLAREQAAYKILENNHFISGRKYFSTLNVSDMIITDIYNNQQWAEFIAQTVPILEEQGWEISFTEDFDLKINDIQDWHMEIEESSGENWFEMILGFELDGKNVNLLPLLVNLLGHSKNTETLYKTLNSQEYQLFQLSETQWIKIPTKRIIQILETLIELYDRKPLNENGNLEFSKYAGLNYGNLLNDPNLKWKGAKALQVLTKKLEKFKGIKTATLPQKLVAELRDYQQIGFDWLSFLHEYEFNGILADDMGLGKTLQVLTLLLKEKENKKVKYPHLIIAPTSLMSNWKNEVKKFTPDLSVLILQGAKRKQHFDDLEKYDIILTTYPLMRFDNTIHEKQNYHYLILDEAQAIKNSKTKTNQIIYKLKSKHRLCVTGTPLENHLGELWSMFHFLMPGYLGNLEQFNRLFRKPIEKEGDSARGSQLRKRIMPFMLRRTKDIVAKELPPKTEIIRTVSLTGKQRELYETVRLAMDKKVRAEIQKKGVARSHIMILDALLKLRQVCCDPQLVKLEKAKKVHESAKLALLMDMLPEMVEEGRKILLFSQFTGMLNIIKVALKKHKISFTTLTGQTIKREEAINKFQEGDAKVFLISLKAGGVGLNLTAADTVIHYDPWWNPAVENQATDRAHRLGQDKPVFVYKLITDDTVEEKILALQAKKQALADSLYSAKKEQNAPLEQADLMALLAPLK